LGENKREIEGKKKGMKGMKWKDAKKAERVTHLLRTSKQILEESL